MPNLTLQERVEEYAAKGLKVLGKNSDDTISIKDLRVLICRGMIRSTYALLLTEGNKTMSQSGIELGQTPRYSKVMEAMSGFVPPDKLYRSAAAYILSMYHMSDDEGREQIKDELFKDLVAGVFNADTVLLTIINYTRHR